MTNEELADKAIRQWERLNKCFISGNASGILKQCILGALVGKNVPPDHVRGDDQVDRQLLGTLPITADGCVMGECAKVFCDCGCGFIGEFDTGKSVAHLDQADGEESIVPREECYSTKEAVEEANRKEEECPVKSSLSTTSTP